MSRARPGGFRLDDGGLIERSKPLLFYYDNQPMHGFVGDTLASALLANGVRTLARSFKYHRQRGIIGAGFEDPCAMLAVKDGYGYDPAVRAGQVRLAEGLEAFSVTGWPSPRLDLGALGQAFAPLLKAGFYYKTFMSPDWSWYEPLIRRATGYGRPRPGPAKRPREARFDSCDVLVIGAGAAGLAAAAGLVGRGLKVIVADDAPRPGGALRWLGDAVEGMAGAEWAARIAARIRADGDCRLLTDTVVAGAYEGNFFTLVEADWCDGLDGAPGGVRRERLWQLQARHVVLATGSVDRPLVFEGNDRPGIMLANAIERHLGLHAVAPGAKLALFTNNDAGYRTASAALAAGVEVTALIDTRFEPNPELVAAIAAAGVPCHLGSEVVATHGRGGLRAIDIAPRDGGLGRRFDCDALAVTGGVTPLVHLAAQRGIKPVFDDAARTFVCPTLPAGWHAVGDVAGPCTVERAVAEGVAAADAIRAETTGSLRAVPAPRPTLPPGDVDTAWRARRGDPGKMFVDLQNDVTLADIELAASEGYVSVEHLKRYTTLGMGTDQGRTSNINGLSALGAATKRAAGTVGTTTFRPPFVGMRMSTIAGVRQGELYRPHRLLPGHDVHAGLGAHFEEFGWRRPDWYAVNGAGREAAVGAEMAAVRDRVGIFDASPLGKIEIAGPDAADFLNRFYVTNLMTLKPGRIRYSVMLKEDGIVFDDGVVARVDETLFIAGPSSGHADAVAQWFERWRQTEWPEMRVAIAPVTSNWACVAIAGPRARDLLAGLEPEADISAEALPHMSFVETRVSGLPARISRVSFTGEMQYEIAVPARHGAWLLGRTLELGQPFGAAPVGMEAWLRLRLEKGYLHVGTDTDGRTTPGDIGMAGVVAAKAADFIGKRSLSLAYGASAEREELVGLKPLKGALAPGGRILADGRTPPCPTEGRVTSACYSPTLGHHVGLALVLRGHTRMGERVRVFDGGEIIEAEICAPTFYDPGNERLRA